MTDQINNVETIFENASFALWHQGDDIAIGSFKTKANTVDELVLAGIMQAVTIVENDFKGLILWQRTGNDFSFGANLKMMLELAEKEGAKGVLELITNFQKAAMRLRYSKTPTIAALRGRVLGGGCELALHCARIVAAQQTNIGLVEVGVGLIPAGGGTKEFALRSVNAETQKVNLNSLLEHFKNIARAVVSTDAEDAVAKCFLKYSDVIVPNADDLLSIAKRELLVLINSGYKMPTPKKFPVAGKAGLDAIKLLLATYAAENLISEYDEYLCVQIATVICGGDVAENTIVDEEHILKLERDVFVEFLMQPKSQERIAKILKK